MAWDRPKKEIYFIKIKKNFFVHLKHVAEVTPALLAADLCPDQTGVSDDPQQVSADWKYLENIC